LEANKAEVQVHWQMFSTLAAGIFAPEEAIDAMSAPFVVCRSDETTAWRGSELRRVTTAPRLRRDGVAARAAASSA
jgi:hypothetical protein